MAPPGRRGGRRRVPGMAAPVPAPDGAPNPGQYPDWIANLTAPFHIQNPVKRELALCGVKLQKHMHFPHDRVTPEILADPKVCLECREEYSEA